MWRRRLGWAVLLGWCGAWLPAHAAWTGLNVNGTNIANLRRGAHSMVYNSADHSVLIFGGPQYRVGVTDIDVWKIPLTSGSSATKLTISGNSFPGTKYDCAAIFHPSENAMFVVGGDQAWKDHNVWKLSLGSSPSWTPFSAGGNTLINRIRHTAVYNPTDNSMIMFGGQIDAVFKNDVWKFSFGTKAWSQLFPGGSDKPSARVKHSAVYDAADNSMVVFGGAIANGDRLNDVWKLSLTGNPAWTKLTPTSTLTLPEGRATHAAIYNPTDDSMVILGGGIGETWQFNFTTSNWTLARDEFGTVGAVAVLDHAAVYDPTSNAMVIQGGKYVGESQYAYSISSLALAPGKYVVSGKITNSAGLPVSGVTLTATGGTSAVTGSSGFYALQLTQNGTFTVAPSRKGYVFSPTALTFAPLSANQSSQTFSATTYTLSGLITDPEGTPLPGAVVTLSGAEDLLATVNTAGRFTFSGVPLGLYTLAPAKFGYIFFPMNRGLSLTTHDVDQHFIALQPAPFQATRYFYGSKWGSSGSGNGQFNTPLGLAINLTGAVTVVDSVNNRIQTFNKAGEYLSQTGSAGPGNGQFSSPAGLDIDPGGAAFVADTGNHRIQKVSGAGVLLTLWGSSGSGNGQFSSPGAVASDPFQHVYVADTGNHRVQKFGQTANYLTQWGSAGSGDGQFSSPGGIAADYQGNIYVADTGNHRIQKFTPTGTFVAKWGTSGSGNSQFSSPTGIAVDMLGNIYVADTGNHRIQKFSQSLTLMAVWGSSGADNGLFSGPKHLAVDAKGNVFVADTGNHRIQKFYPGSLITGIVKDQAGLPVTGVTLSVLGGAQVQTAANGSYAVTLISGLNYTIKPGKSGHQFGPFQRTYLPLTVDQASQNYLALSNLVSVQGGGTIVHPGDLRTQVKIPPLFSANPVTVRIQTTEEFESTDQVLVTAAANRAPNRVLASGIRNFLMSDQDGQTITSFTKLATVEIPYTDDDNDGIVDGTTLSVAKLKMMRLNESRLDWVTVSDGGANTVDTTRKVVSAEVKHFSFYTIGSSVSADLGALSVYPNPVNFATAVRNAVKFDKLTQGAGLKIFDLKGRLVKDLPVGSSVNDGTSGHVEWDGKNEQGESVAPGLYFFTISDTAGNRKSGKLAVTDQ